MAMTALAVGIRELIGGSEGGRATAAAAAVLTMVFVATIRLTALEAPREALGILVGTALGVLAAVAASVSGSAVVVLAALAVACGLPGAAAEVGARWPGVRDETGG